MIVRRQRADALEFLGPHLDTGQSFGIVEMRNAVVGHPYEPSDRLLKWARQ
jgi:hypothetical protein